ncbi:MULTISPECIES: hypothetical protein [unclassified Pedobacter]|uniref:hypothetical protein n=1 Tax=unclassified Pedobacter TaxID=2628915 RepID=UPI001424222E|nr:MULTISPECIES: hypothetical protein [unclassified Pedobacter]NII83878.1 hypothetical protein [Pedobacter sp. SG908]
MRIIIILIMVSLTCYGCSPTKRNNDHMGFFNKLFGKKDNTNRPDNEPENIDYKNKLLATKAFYPFDRWRQNYNNGLTQYTTENCNKVKKVFDDLISSLIEIGVNAGEEQKKQLFKTAILKTNQLNEEIDSLIETGEREDLCNLTNKITIACGLNPAKYGEGEGLASEWREW